MSWPDVRRPMKSCALWCLLLSFLSFPALAADFWTYWVEPCDDIAARDSHCKASDPELARWALESWQQASAGSLEVKRVAVENAARLRVYWVTGRSQLYGEARPIVFEGKRGSQVYVLPSAARPGEDPLNRETIVYLTCLHETGHALGLAHTDQFADIMYSFQYGGDIAEYFGRFRRQLKGRTDIEHASGMSAADRVALRAALSAK